MIRSSIVYVGIAPHPPIMIPEVGGSAIEEVRASIDAMHEMTSRIIASNAETVVLISPHAPLDSRAFVTYADDNLHGSFENFRAPGVEISATLDDNLLDAIVQSARERGYDINPVLDEELDHGTTVPLYFLQRNGWNGKVVSLGYTFLSNQDHLDFGVCIRNAVDSKGKPVAIVASGDLSHRLKHGAPAGYNEDAHSFDEEVVEALRAGAPERIVNIDQKLRSIAGECGYRSMLVAVGAADGLEQTCDVLSYEAPFGVGYMVAQLVNIECDVAIENPPPASVTTDQSFPQLARRAVEAFVRDGYQIRPDFEVSHARAGCFVSIKTLDGHLRGCVGTIEPAGESLEECLVANAINAATRDPRFPAVTEAELSNLRYSVDVLSEVVSAGVEDLDPQLFGVVVQEEGSGRRGVLLPAIEGVESAEHQIEIATRKAGIQPSSPVKLYRFSVSRFRESVS